MARLSQFDSQNFNREGQKPFEEELQSKYNKFSGMNSEQLHNELFREVARQKTAGTFDYQSLSNMVENLRGSLPQNEYENIKRILETLR